MILYDFIWFYMIWYYLVGLDMIWYDFYDMIWFNMILYGLIWFERIWYDLIWFDKILYGLIWFDMIGLTWVQMCSLGLIWLDLGDLEYNGQYWKHKKATKRQTDRGFLGCTEILLDLIMHDNRLFVIIKEVYSKLLSLGFVAREILGVTWIEVSWDRSAPNQ